MLGSEELHHQDNCPIVIDKSYKPELTQEEIKTIKALRRLGKKWPQSLYIFCGGQSGVAVLKKNERNESIMHTDGVACPAQIVAIISGIDADGGDW